MKRVLSIGLTGGLIFATFGASDFVRLGFNNPTETVFLKAGFACDRLRVTDVDQDGQPDLILYCSGKGFPWGGVYYYRNPTPKGRKDVDPVFEPARKVDPKSLPPLEEQVWGTGRDGKSISNVHYTDGVERPDFWVGRSSQGGDDHFADLDGDGVADMIIRAGDRRMDAWMDCYDARGNWREPQFRSFLYWCKGLGQRRFDDPRMIYLENDAPLEVQGGHTTFIRDWDRDGDLDFILLDISDTFTYFENIGSKTNPVFTAGRFLRAPDGSRVHGDLCLARGLAYDWDGDGFDDILFSEEDSRVAWMRNTGRVIDRLPEFEHPRYFRQRADELNFGALCCPWVVDWDGDGDEDILSGNSHGQIAFIENLSGRGVEFPRWARPKLLTEPDGHPIWVRAGRSGSIQGPAERKWGYMTISVADWDGDGLPDIMGNNSMGIVYWWKNIGTRRHPKLDFARRVPVAWEDGQPELAWGWMKPKNQKDPNELLTQWRTTPVMFDWNGDGLMDLVMLDQEGYLCLFERARKESGELLLKSPARVFLDTRGFPLRTCSTFRKGVGCGRRKLCICDWDGDGKQDLIMNGEVNAELFLQVGKGNRGWMFKSAGAIADLKLSTHDPQPASCDFNGDGKTDLILGAMDGYFYYLRNSYREKRGE